MRTPQIPQPEVLMVDNLPQPMERTIEGTSLAETSTQLAQIPQPEVLKADNLPQPHERAILRSVENSQESTPRVAQELLSTAPQLEPSLVKRNEEAKRAFGTD